MIMVSSPYLLDAYKAWLSWAEVGAPEWNEYGFSKVFGMCSTFERFGRFPYVDIRTEMKNQFKQAGLDVIHPFGFSNYMIRKKNETQHLDPVRLAWVRARIKEASE